MEPSPTLNLFIQQTDLGPRPLTFVASIFLHILTIAIVTFGIAYRPPVVKIATEHFEMRELDLHVPDLRMPPPKNHIPSPVRRPPAPRPVTPTKLAPQTLLQPDLLKYVSLPEKIPLPQILIWAPSKTPLMKVAPPVPQKLAAAAIKPEIERPNEEPRLADVNLASSFHPSDKSIVAPSTVSPVAIPGLDQVQAPPIASSQPSAEGTPAAIVSMSDLLMTDGTAILPAVNEAAPSNDKADPGPGLSSTGEGSSARGTDSGSDLSGRLASTQVSLPKDGRFSAVIVGNALDDQFPELAGLWSGRLAYTVYLHVGLPRNWILQYSLPLSDDPSAGGTVIRLDAPWPYSIVRPDLAPGLVDADALIIHGFINQLGHFETLRIVIPQVFPQAQFVLAALDQWQFRPAMQGGLPAKVEVLLIVPEALE